MADVFVEDISGGLGEKNESPEISGKDHSIEDMIPLETNSSKTSKPPLANNPSK